MSNKFRRRTQGIAQGKATPTLHSHPTFDPHVVPLRQSNRAGESCRATCRSKASSTWSEHLSLSRPQQTRYPARTRLQPRAPPHHRPICHGQDIHSTSRKRRSPPSLPSSLCIHTEKNRLSQPSEVSKAMKTPQHRSLPLLGHDELTNQAARHIVNLRLARIIPGLPQKRC